MDEFRSRLSVSQIAAVVFVVMLLWFTSALYCAYTDSVKDYNTNMSTAIEEEWDFYLDGKLVDSTNMNLQMGAYRVQFDDVNKAVKLATKHSSRRVSHIPIFYYN